MITIIAGSREIDDYAEICRAVKFSNFDITRIISGGARGVDRLGERYAQDNEISFSVINAEWDSFGKSAGHRRNVEMAKKANALIAVYNFRSPGTKGMIKTAIHHGLKVYIHAHDAFLEMYTNDFRYVLRFYIKNGRFYVTIDDLEADFPITYSAELGQFSLNKIKLWSYRLNDIIIESQMANDDIGQSLIRLAFYGNSYDSLCCKVKLPHLEGTHSFMFHMRSRVYRRNRRLFDSYIEQLRCMVSTSIQFLDDSVGES